MCGLLTRVNHRVTEDTETAQRRQEQGKREEAVCSLTLCCFLCAFLCVLCDSVVSCLPVFHSPLRCRSESSSSGEMFKLPTFVALAAISWKAIATISRGSACRDASTCSAFGSRLAKGSSVALTA